MRSFVAMLQGLSLQDNHTKSWKLKKRLRLGLKRVTCGGGAYRMFVEKQAQGIQLTGLFCRRLGRMYRELTPEERAALADEGRDATLAHRHSNKRSRRRPSVQGKLKGLAGQAEGAKIDACRAKAAKALEKRHQAELLREWTENERAKLEKLLGSILPPGFSWFVLCPTVSRHYPIKRYVDVRLW
jgi:hypothetical protein